MNNKSNFMSVSMVQNDNGEETSMGYQNINKNGLVREHFFKKNDSENNKKQILGKSTQYESWKSQLTNNGDTTETEYPYEQFKFKGILSGGKNHFVPKMINQNSQRESFDDFDLVLPTDFENDNVLDKFFQPLVENDPFKDPFFNT